MHEIKEKLVSCLKAEMAKGIENVDTKEAGEVVDMIKDIAQCEKYCWEAEYYRSVVEAMGGNTRAGYIPKRPWNRPYEDRAPYADEYLHDRSDPRYGRAYNEYRESRRYYTETNSPAYRQEMDAHAAEHVGDTLATIREIWKTADPEMKKRIKADFTTLVNEMTV